MNSSLQCSSHVNAVNCLSWNNADKHGGLILTQARIPQAPLCFSLRLDWKLCRRRALLALLCRITRGVLASARAWTTAACYDWDGP